MEDKKRYGRIQHAPFKLELALFDFASFPKLRSDLHGKRFSDLDGIRPESDLQKNTVW